MANRLQAFLLLILTALAVVLAGCGGGGGGSPDSGFGTASFTIEWPDRAIRLAVAESVRIVIRSDTATIANQLFDRPTTGSASTFDIDPVPAGTYSVEATAYSQPAGAGDVAGAASGRITVRSDETTSLTFSASATVDHMDILADTTAIAINGTAHLTALPRSASDAIVLVPTGNLTWESLDPTIASVDSAGVVTGLTTGTAEIKATETGSGVNSTAEITVNGAKWTVMVYMAADNNLETYALQDLNEMETIGSTSSLSVVVQVDRSPNYDTTNGNWSGARRYKITKDSDPSIFHSQLISDLGTSDMADPNTLKAFVNWAADNYPAERYCLVLWDHGRGWRNRMLYGTNLARDVKAIFVDDSSSNEMTLSGMTQALEQSPHTDAVLFDACLMGMLEVAYSIRNCSDVMVASEENVPVEGQAYGAILNSIKSDPDITPSDLGRAIVDEYVDYYATYFGTFTMSAVDLLALDDLVSASDNLASVIIANIASIRTGVRTAQAGAQHYDYDLGEYRYYKDLYDFARLVNDNVGNSGVRTAAQNVMSKVDDVVIYQRHSGATVANSHGVSIYLPDPGTMLNSYTTLDFSSATNWNEMLTAY